MIDPTASDWSDLDLLTKAEASERLSEEIGAIERQLTHGSEDLDGPGRDALERRLSLLRKRFDQ